MLPENNNCCEDHLHAQHGHKFRARANRGSFRETELVHVPLLDEQSAFINLSSPPHLAVAVHSDLVFNIHIAAVLALHPDILPLRCHDERRQSFLECLSVLERGFSCFLNSINYHSSWKEDRGGGREKKIDGERRNESA